MEMDFIWQAILAGTAGGGASVFQSLALARVARRSYAVAALLQFFAVLAAAAFWRLMGDAVYWIPFGMLAVGLGVPLVLWLCDRTPAILVPGVSFSAGFWLACLGLLTITFLFRMTDGEVVPLVSPDGKYKAVFSYRDGPTFGFYHVTLERAAYHGILKPAEVSEVAAEGMDGIAWSGPRTLIVQYSCPEDEWVVRHTRWGDVRIVYQRSPVSPPAPAGK